MDFCQLSIISEGWARAALCLSFIRLYVTLARPVAQPAWMDVQGDSERFYCVVARLDFAALDMLDCGRTYTRVSAQSLTAQPGALASFFQSDADGVGT